MGCTDVTGLDLSTSSSEALQAYEHGVDLTLRWRGGILDAFDAAVTHDPRFVLAHCARAYTGVRMGLFGTALEARQQAQALADDVQHERERLHIQVVDAMMRSDQAMSQVLLEQITWQYPADRFAVWMLNWIYFAQGNYQGGLALSRRCLDACPQQTVFHTMYGFYLEQAGNPGEGLEASLQALAADPTNLYTYHAVGHAYQAQGDYPNALATFERSASIERYPHNLWHLAEMQALLGHERLTRDYWASTTPVLPLFERIELLWRLDVIRHAPIDEAVWKELAEQGERLLQYANYLTIWMHHWIGVAFARVGATAKAQEQVERLRRLPDGRPGGFWATLGADLLEGEMALLRGDLEVAAQLMAPAIQHIHDLGGGSREQKDIFQDVFLEINRRLGNVDQVIDLAQHRLVGNPRHLQSLGALIWAYGQTGQPLLRRQAAHRFVAHATEAGMHPQAPELLVARQAQQA